MKGRSINRLYSIAQANASVRRDRDEELKGRLIERRPRLTAPMAGFVLW